MNIKQESIDRLSKHIAEYTAEIATLHEIADALKAYKGKMYDKRFLRASGFVSERDYGYGKREFFKHELRKHRWNWKSGYEIHIGTDDYIEVESRECVHVLPVILSEIEKRTEWKNQAEQSLRETQASDVDTVRAKLIELRDTSGITEQLWRELLDEYDVKYM